MARNVIERWFGILKGRWAIHRSPSWFSIKTHNRIVMACCLLHNLIKKHTLLESLYNDTSYEYSESDGGEDEDEVEYLASTDNVGSLD